MLIEEMPKLSSKNKQKKRVLIIVLKRKKKATCKWWYVLNNYYNTLCILQWHCLKDISSVLSWTEKNLYVIFGSPVLYMYRLPLDQKQPRSLDK